MMGMVMSEYKFEGPAPELEAVRAEIEAISGLPVLLTEEPYRNEHGKKIGSHFYLAFRDVPKNELRIERGKILSITVKPNIKGRREWDEYVNEIDDAVVILTTYIGCEVTLLEYACTALEKLGGKEITSTPNAELLPLPSASISLDELKKRHQKNKSDWIPLMIVSNCVFWLLFGWIILLSRLFEYLGRARGRLS